MSHTPSYLFYFLESSALSDTRARDQHSLASALSHLTTAWRADLKSLSSIDQVINRYHHPERNESAILILHASAAHQWLDQLQSNHMLAQESATSTKPIKPASKNTETTKPVCVKLPPGVIVWAAADEISASEVVAWYHVNASDVAIIDTNDQQLSDAQVVEMLSESLSKADRQLKLLNMGESLLAENQRLQKRIEVLLQDQFNGKILQQSLMPAAKSEIQGVQLESIVIPAIALSGDFIDYFKIDDNTIGFYLADVVGHGVGAAMITILLKNMIGRYLMLDREKVKPVIREPHTLLTKINKNLQKGEFDRHVTMIYGVIDLKREVLHYINAGHFPAPQLWDGAQWHTLEGTSAPVGLYEEVEYETQQIALTKRYQLLLFSDGILERFAGGSNDEKIAYLRDKVRHGGEQGLTVDQITAEFDLDNSQQVDDFSLLSLTRK